MILTEADLSGIDRLPSHRMPHGETTYRIRCGARIPPSADRFGFPRERAIGCSAIPDRGGYTEGAMQYQFTSSARRALIHAARWCMPQFGGEVAAPALLLGLLAETESRAAITLARCGVDAEAVHERWPELVASSNGGGSVEDGYFAEDTNGALPPLSNEVKSSLGAASRRMKGFDYLPTFATEHLLLGLTAAGFETAQWLRELGLDPDLLEDDIYRQYGQRAGVGGLHPEPLMYEEGPANHAESITLPSGLVDSSASGPVAGALPNPELPASSSLSQQWDAEMGMLRVLDAAANRAREALRVLEDYVRFVLDDRYLTGELKQFRHDLTGAMADVPLDRRLQARETLADVGTELATESEYRRDGMTGLLAANFSRLQESLRSLEEFGKLHSPSVATRCERLRYRTYTLQRAVQITGASLQRLAGVRLYLLIDAGGSADDFAATVRSLVAAGVDAIQLRDKQLDDRPLLERARTLRELTRASRTLFIMNDRPDLAVLSEADGVHVGQEELTVKDARTIVGPDALVGVSTHSVQQARQAVLDGANYIGVGPTFPSGTKKFEHFPGLDLVREVAREIRLPAFAIGGITPENVSGVMACGMGRVAVSGCITKAADPSQAVRRMRAVLEGADLGG